jgi:hypothetical protein
MIFFRNLRAPAETLKTYECVPPFTDIEQQRWLHS